MEVLQLYVYVGLKVGDFTLFLCRVQQKQGIKREPHARAARFFFHLLANDIFVLWRCICRSCHRFF